MLYLCRRKSIPAFKAGTTKPVDLKRLKDLQTKYDGDFDFAESYLVKAKDDRTTIDLEWQLKRDLKEYRHEIEEEKTEGFSEFYDIKALPMVLNYIEVKAKAFEHLGLTIEKGIEFKTPWKQRKVKLISWGENSTRYFYHTLKLILKNKDKFTYYEEDDWGDGQGGEGKVGVLVSRDIRFLSERFVKTAIHYFFWKSAYSHRYFMQTTLNLDFELSKLDTQEEEEKRKKLKYGFLATRIVVKNPSMAEYTKADYEERQNIIVNARVAYFQRICKRELAPTPKELQTWNK